MNYGKNNLSKRKSSISSKKKMKKKRVGVRFFKAVITCMLLLVVIGLVGGIIFAKKIIDNTPDVSAEDIQPKGFTTKILIQTVSTVLMTRSRQKQIFFRMHLWRSRTNVSMNITESIFREF